MVDTIASLAPHHLDQLRRACGEVITPGDATYDDARRLWNAIHDRRPAIIVRPTSATRVATAIRFAREHDLEIVVKSGGHSAAGFKGADGCLVIDMSAMRGVEVDPRTRTARSNGGALLGELDIAAQAHGLVCPTGVVGHTGVAGLTLGGGVGRLQRTSGSRSTTWSPSRSRPPTAASSARLRRTSPSCSGACAAPAGTSGSRPHSSSGSIRSGPISTGASWPSPRPRSRMSGPSSATTRMARRMRCR